MASNIWHLIIMDIEKQKEQFSIAYVNAIAAHAGLNNASLSVDDDSVDLLIKGRGFKGKIRNPQLELQLKCTSQDIINGGFVNFPLSLKNYEDLRGDNVLCPRYLVVLIVPEDTESWSQHNENELIRSNSGYWGSIRDYPETKNRTNVTVKIPLAQKLTKESLLGLMEQASEGGYL